jgi:LysR family hydrogen peroxide-inducible transcriptional activator
MISIQQMQYIVTVAEERQFQRASERCFVTQPTLSMQIKKAEDTLENKIFDRSRSPLELTNYGKRLLPILRDVLSEYDRIRSLSEMEKGEFREQLRIAVIPTIAGYLLPQLFDQWIQELEDVELTIEEMKTEDMLVALEEKTIDLGILAGPVHHPKWRTNVLYHEEILAYTSNCNEPTILSSNLEKEHPWLLSKGNCLRTQMIHFCELEGASDKGWNYEGGNIELLIKMVDIHGGYTLVPEHYAASLRIEGMQRIESDELHEHPAREIIAISPNRSPKWHAIERLIRTVQLRYGQQEHENLKLLDWK